MKKIVAVFAFVCMVAGSACAQVFSSCDPAPPGMVGWWKGDGNGNDNVGADNAAVPTGVTYAPGEVALGFNLNGNTNRILAPDAPQLNFGPNKDFSVEAWILPLSNPGNYTDLTGEVMTLVSKRYSPNAFSALGYEMYLGNGRLCFQMIDVLNNGGNYYNLGAESDLRDGQFHHVAVTVQRNSTTGLRFYVDGQLVATFDPTAVRGDLSNASPLRIGNHPDPGIPAFYHGVIDEVSLYSRALSANEIAGIYGAGSAGKCPVPPTILAQPTNQTVAVGGTATFRVSVNGTPPLFYQWSFNGTNIPGATNSSLTLTNVQPAQAGRYAVWVAMPYGSINSSNAVLTVLGTTTCDPAPSGLVAWWKGDGNGNDNVGADNATVPTGVTYIPGEVGLGFNLNGNTNRILAPDAPQLNFGPNKDFSVEAWIQPLSNPGNYTDLSGEVMTLVSKRYSPNAFTALGYEMYLGGGRLCFQMIDALNHGGNYYNLSAEPDLRDGQFHHVAVTVQRNSTTGLQFYVDGQLIATFDPTVVSGDLSNTSPLRIGNHPDPGIPAFYRGIIDEVSLYSRALSANEIAGIYGVGSAGKCPPLATGPVIITQPTNQTVTVGGTATFRVAASGTPPLFYQWRFNGTNILGATNTLVTLNNVQPAQAGNYSVQVANAGGSTNSVNAVLTVNTAGSCDPAPSGLVAWWKGEGNASDSIGANNGMLSNGAALAGGKVGQAFSFNGFSQYVNVPRSSSLNSFSNQLTIEFWMYANPSNLMNTYQGLVTSDYYGVEISDGHGGNVGINWYINTPAGEYLISTVNGGGIPVSSGQWHHIAGTYDGAKLQLYIDGLPSGNAQTASGSILPMLTTSFVAIGSDDGRTYCGCTGRYFRGLIDEVSIYKRALSSNEIAGIYNAGSAGKCPLPATGPVIITQPTNQTVGVGATATFAVAASGSAPFIYQWRFNGTNILGATNVFLILPNVQPTQAGNYSVQVANAGGSTNSANAMLTVTTPSSCDPAPSGLVGWWKGERNANDNAGTNNGSLSASGATYATGEVGQGFRFDGTNGYVQIPDSNALKPANVTCEAWVWLDPSLPSHNGGEQIVFKKNTWSAWFEGYSLLKITIDNGDGTYSDRFQFCISREGNQVAINSQTIAQRGVWYHVAATYDGSQSKLYVNGVMEASATPGFALDYDTTPIFIGTSGTWAPYLSMFGGIIDEVSIYKRALSSNEIAAIYNAGSAGKCPLPGTGPVIIAQPTNQTVTVGGMATFRVAASGTPPLFYQWRFNGTNILGATNMLLTLNNIQLTQAGNYFVQVANAGGSTNSINAVLTVNTAGSCDPAPSGLVGWWQAEGNANDSAGTNNGTQEGGLGFAAGKVGQAFLFNNTNADVRIPASSNLNVGVGNGFTLEAWINPSDVTRLLPLFEWNAGNGTTYWGVHFYSTAQITGELYANIVDSGGGWHIINSAGGVVVSGVFQHVALTYDKASGVATIYRNGTVVVQKNIGSFTPQTTYNLILGRRPGPEAIFTFVGLLDEPSIYNRALSSNEIAAIYIAGGSGKCSLTTNYVSGVVGLPPQPTLATVKTGANLQLSWPVSTGNFQVQSADSPLGPWTDTTMTIITNGANATVTVIATNQQQYFRLVGQ